MINIEAINLGLATADAIDWFIPQYRTNQPLTVIVYLCSQGFPINNWNDTPIGIKLEVPDFVYQAWGTDDSVIDNWILTTLNFKKA